MKHRFERGLSLAACLLALSGASLAHDSWFARLGAPPSDALLALGTGDRFPVHEFAIDPKFVTRDGCRWPDGRTRPLIAVRVASTALVFRPAQPGASACWAQLQPFDVEVEPDKVDLYLDEINAGPAVRARWSAIKARGLPWRERYTKHARIELRGAAPGQPGQGKATDMAVDLHRVSGPEPENTRVRDVLVFELRRDGRPVAGVPLELRHAAGAAATWHQTDALGRVTVQASAAGEWLLRGVDLRWSRDSPDAWESDFVTIAFTVAP